MADDLVPSWVAQFLLRVIIYLLTRYQPVNLDEPKGVATQVIHG